MRVLVVEDEPSLSAQIAGALRHAGFAVDVAGDGAEAELRGEIDPYDAIVLDLGLPKIDGLSILRAWRGKGRTMPVLILTARSGWHAKVQGLNAGADDYLAKPFEMPELTARLRALIRRSAGHPGPVLTCGPISLDTTTKRVAVDGRPVTLTANEYRTLSYLMHRRGRVVSRGELAAHIYEQERERESNTVEVFIGRIRRKLRVDAIRTVRGLGYRLEAP